MAERLPEFDPDKRPRQLRRRLLVLAHLQKGVYENGWVPARNFLAVRDDEGKAIATEDEAIDLIGDLVALKLLEEWIPQGMSGKQRGFGQRRFKLTDRGYALYAQEIDAIPSIADERLGD